jgi:hypothetical protein
MVRKLVILVDTGTLFTSRRVAPKFVMGGGSEGAVPEAIYKPVASRYTDTS